MTDRAIAVSLATILLGLNAGIGTVHAENTDTELVLMPHCAQADRSQCPSFPALDPQTLSTEKMNVGDIVDLDIVLKTLRPSDIETVRAWLSYNPSLLEARSVELSSNTRSPLPGEQTIEKTMGIVKVGANVGGKILSSDSVIARVTFRVIRADAHTLISFHNYLPGGTGQTVVNGKEGATTDSRTGALPKPPCFDKILGCSPQINALLAIEPSKLQVTLAGPSATTAYAEEPPVAANTSTGTPTVTATIDSPAVSGSKEMNLPTSPMPNANAGSAFTLLQVQNLRITTRDRDIYIGWMPLRSSELKGYNVYYSTVSGRYAQRHSLPATAESYTIRDLEQGTVYFISVRAFNQSDIESAFSQEVSVTVGEPETSTAPLSSALARSTVVVEGNPIARRDGSTITGETGTSSIVFIVVIASAVLGTALAFHRQLILHRTHDNA